MLAPVDTRARAATLVTAALGGLAIAQVYLELSILFWDSWPEGGAALVPTLLLSGVAAAYAVHLARRLRADRPIERSAVLVGLLLPPLAGITDGWQLYRESVWLPELHWAAVAVLSLLVAGSLYGAHRAARAALRVEVAGQRGRSALVLGALSLVFAAALVVFRVLGGPGAEDGVLLRVSEIAWGVLGALLVALGAVQSSTRRA